MKILFDTPKFDCYQTFFIERAYELLYQQTIDSYRARVMNAPVILSELLTIIEGRVKGKIKDFKTVESCRDEAIYLVESDEVMTFHTFSKSYFVELLKSIKSEKDDNEVKDSKELKILFSKLKTTIRTVLSENKDYAQKLFEKIDFYLKNPVEPTHDEFRTFRPIDNLTVSLITELISLGYHKSFLFKRINHLFVNYENSFEDAFNELRQLTQTDEKNYRIWFKFSSTKEICQTLSAFNQFLTHESISKENEEADLSKFKQFARSSESTRFLLVKQRALDYFSALYKAKNMIAENLDILNLGFGHIKSKLYESAAVVDVAFPEKAEIKSIKPLLDGSYTYGQILFNKLYDKIPSLLNKTNISTDAKEKLKSAFRYLRLGNEAIEVEHQFINYWVGLEYLFANYSDSSFTRIKHFLPIIQALSYVKRNALDLHKRVAPLATKLELEYYNDDEQLSCILKEAYYDEIKHKVFPVSPLLSYRAWKLQHRFFQREGESQKKLGEYIGYHTNGLRQHLIRIYRIRNEIVHEAQYNTNNENLTANLKYYLVFSLSVILDYLEHYSEGDIISLDDFFQLQEAKYDNFGHQNYPLDKILEIGDDYAMLGG